MACGAKSDSVVQMREAIERNKTSFSVKFKLQQRKLAQGEDKAIVERTDRSFCAIMWQLCIAAAAPQCQQVFPYRRESLFLVASENLEVFETTLLSRFLLRVDPDGDDPEALKFGVDRSGGGNIALWGGGRIGGWRGEAIAQDVIMRKG